MVKKLYKHEFLAWLRIFWVIYALMLTLATAHRILQCFENDSVAYSVVSALTTIIFVLSVIIILCAPVFFGIARFQNHLFSGEGYLTFTLPVTAGQHLWVKGITAAAMSLLTGLVCCVSVLIITAGEVHTELWKAAAYLLRKIPADSVWNIIGYTVELLTLLVVSVFGSHMLYNTCICVGQLFRKNRKLAAVGVYFGYYYLMQFLGTVFSAAATGWELTSVAEFIANHVELSLHLGYLGALLMTALQAAACWLICHVIISRKLNLE